MADKFLQADIIANFTGGKNTIYEADEIEITQARECLNCNLMNKLGIQPRQGATIDGTFSTTTNPITNAHTFTTKSGLERPVRGTGTILEYKNTYIDTPDWLTLETGFTTGKIFGFADGDTKAYLCNGVEVMRSWSMAMARFNLATSTATIIGLKAEGALTSAALLGFSATGSVIIAGNTYTYTGLSGLTLTGVNTTPLGEADGAGVAEKPITSGFTSAPVGNILLIKDSRLLVAGDPTNPNNVYGSKIGNVVDFSFSSPAVADDGFVAKYWGKPITALGDKGDYVAVMKNDGGKVLKFTKIQGSSGTILTTPVIEGLFDGTGLGAVNQKSTLQLDYDFIFTSKSIGLRRITRATGNDVDKPEGLTDNIQDDFDTYDLTDAAAGSINQQIYLGLRSTSDLTGNDAVILKDMTNNFIGTFQGINASCFFTYNNKLYYGDSYTKNCWQLNNGEYADYNGTDYLDYTFRWKSKYFHYGVPDQFKELGYIWIEGIITPNTIATLKINLLTETGVEQKQIEINGTDKYVNKALSSALGHQKFGEKRLAWGEDKNIPTGSRDFHRMISCEKLGIKDIKWLKMQLEIETSKAGDFIRVTKIRPLVFIMPIDKTKTNSILNNSNN
jgi:hypothetical protein